MACRRAKISEGAGVRPGEVYADQSRESRDMTFKDLLTTLLAVGLTIVVVVRVPKFWRGETDHDPFVVSPIWPFGAPLWRGAVRAVPALSPLVPLALVVHLLVNVAGYDAETLIVALPAVAILAAITAGWTIALFNRPSRLVAPAWRAQPGAVEEWRSALARRRGTHPNRPEEREASRASAQPWTAKLGTSHKCPVCGWVFGSEGDLDDHRRRSH